MNIAKILSRRLRLTASIITVAGAMLHVSASTSDTLTVIPPVQEVSPEPLTMQMATADSKPSSVAISAPKLPDSFKPHINIYETPYSRTASYHDWHRLWLNTGVLAGAYIGTLGVLQMLPEDATSWNRAAIIKVPLFKRWWRNNFKLGPEWDHDNAVFNYILHPYAGAAYFMAARSCGFNFAQSLLYSACVSTIGWEFGIEAFMERPSYQDLFITPLVGSVIGECFYRVKRNIVSNGYRLAGSPVLGNIVVFICDPVNEVIGLFAGNPCRQLAKRNKLQGTAISSAPWIKGDGMGGTSYGLTMVCTF